jgi:ABC-type metal ion transport system substrate-binding protein
LKKFLLALVTFLIALVSFAQNKDVQGQQYNIGTTTTNISGPLTIQQKNKLTSEEITLVIPYIGIDGFFVPNDFIQFLANWFQENNYGYVYENEAPLMTIYSDLYEYGKFQFSDA